MKPFKTIVVMLCLTGLPLTQRATEHTPLHRALDCWENDRGNIVVSDPLRNVRIGAFTSIPVVPIDGKDVIGREHIERQDEDDLVIPDGSRTVEIGHFISLPMLSGDGRVIGRVHIDNSYVLSDDWVTAAPRNLRNYPRELDSLARDHVPTWDDVYAAKPFTR